jgi:hypothetical protein
MKKPRRKPRNLSLHPDAVARGERYCRRHGTNLSQVVDAFLRSLPLDEGDMPASPVVRRLRGAGKGAADQTAYREHLRRKYKA